MRTFTPGSTATSSSRLVALFAVCLGLFLFRLARLAGIAVGLGLLGFVAAISTSVPLAAPRAFGMSSAR